MDISRGKRAVPNRPSASSTVPPRQTTVNTQPVIPQAPWWRQKKLWLIVAGVSAVLALAVAWWLVNQSAQQSILGDRYQAVHLENGQVFFGKLQNTDGAFLTLKEAYYTPEQAPVTSQSEQATVENTQLALIKVGEEVYGPERSVALRADSVRYWENLRSDSKFVEAITQE